MLFAILSVSIGNSYAQGPKKKGGRIAVNDPKWGLGLKLGDPSGIALKRYMGNHAFDITIGNSFIEREYKTHSYKSGGISATVMYEREMLIPIVHGLDWYFGVGAQVSSRKYYKKLNIGGWDYDETETKIAAGAVGVIGIEYVISQSPVAVFGEFTPYLELTPASSWFVPQGAIGVRYCF